MANLREIRYLSATEVRAVGGSGDADPLRIQGYASVFNTSAQLPGFRETIRPGAFTRAVAEKQDVVCLFNHDSNFVLGRTTSGTLSIRQDERGLYYTCELPNTQTARDIHESIRRGDINGCSFAFTIPDGGQDWSEARDTDGTYFIQRDISNVDLHDVSPVTYPCYSGTEVYARNVAEVPMELRSSVDSKNAALVVPPVIEKRPYKDVSEVPDSVPAGKKKQWMEVWNSVYDKAIKDGTSAKDAESSAFAQANGVVKKRDDETFDPLGQEGEKREIIDAIDTDLDSFEDAISEVCKALCTAFPGDAQEGVASPYPCGRFYECETYEDYVIAFEYATGAYFQIPYTHDESKPVGEQITFGEPVEVEEVWVPSDRTAAKVAEFRTKFPLPVPEVRDEVQLLDELDEDFDRGLAGRQYDEMDEHDDHTDDGDCDEEECACQNRWAPTGSGMRGIVGAIYVGPEPTTETRGGFTRTKRVDGHDLTAKSFAYVGDPDKTTTWKLPIHDAKHVRLALGRFDQTDLPADAKAGAYRKVTAAAKKFGIEVSESKSWPLSAEERERYANALRSGSDQPRVEQGQYGRGSNSEAASNPAQHNDAVNHHTRAALRHSEAAQEHAKASDLQSKKKDATSTAVADEQSKIAQAASKKANRSGGY